MKFVISMMLVSLMLAFNASAHTVTMFIENKTNEKLMLNYNEHSPQNHGIAQVMFDPGKLIPPGKLATITVETLNTENVTGKIDVLGLTRGAAMLWFSNSEGFFVQSLIGIKGECKAGFSTQPQKKCDWDGLRDIELKVTLLPY
ncbi:MAG: hypothetical protein Tsb005_03760 [Gammaproteobacteria bacterium]